MKIVVTKRTDDWHACLENNTAIWACGKSLDEAIGDLIRTHQDVFKIEVQLPK